MKIKKRINSALKYLIKYPIYWVSFLIPKSKKIWIFGAWGGLAYADNARFAFEYVSDHTDINAYWVTKDRDVYNRIIGDGRNCYLYNSFKGFLVGSRASLAVITQTHEDVNMFCCGGIRILNLWHGIPMKKILFDTQNMYNSPDFSIRFTYNYIPFGNRIGRKDFVVSTGPLFDNITMSAFGIPESQVVRIGYPRNDIIYRGSVPDIIFHYKSMGKKIIIYLPTHRNFGLNRTYDPMSNVAELNTLLEANNFVMLYKPHFHEWALFHGEKGESCYHSIVTLEDYDFSYNINTYMPFCDLLVTDYSGAYFDFLLTGKPVIFFDYDLELYKKNTGLYFDYDKIAIGPKCQHWDEVIKECHEALKNDMWKEQRNKLTKEVFYYQDGDNSRRVYDAGTRILSKNEYRE